MITAPYIPLEALLTAPFEHSISVTLEEEKRQDESKVFYLLISNAMSSQLVAIKNKISEIGELKDNWDGYGAVEIPQTTIKNAFKFIETFFKEGFSVELETEVTPTAYGSIVFDFITRNGLVSLEIGKSEIGFFTEFNNAEDLSLDATGTDFRTMPIELLRAFEILVC